MSNAAITVNGLWKYYKKFKALEDINLNIVSGEVFVLIGSNGSGKSTLLKIISGLISWNKGEIRILDHIVTQNKKNNREVRKSLGIMFDHSAHFEKLTGYENAWYFARTLGLNADEARNRLEELFKWTDLWDRRNDPVNEYSYGMKRKLALIESLIHDPEILILDEPTIGLDYTSRVAFFKLLEEKSKEGKTIIVSTNDVTEASMIAAKIALIYKGKLLATGTADELIASLETLTRIEIKLAQLMELNVLNQIEGVEHYMVDEDYKEGSRIWILTKSSNDILPQIVSNIVNLGGSIVSLEIQQPGLKDVFLHYTGDSL